MEGAQKAGRILATVLGGLAILAVCGVVAAWAVARPDADPVTATFERAAARVSALVDSVLPERVAPAPDWTEQAMVVADGDPRKGAALIDRYGCGACHTIPGITRAQGRVGPDLTGFREQAYIAGVLPNRPGPLVDWLQSPPRHSPQTAMPDMGISEAQAEHIAAYLYTLEGR